MQSDVRFHVLSRAIVVVLVSSLISFGSLALAAAPPQGAPAGHDSPIQTGYAVVTPTSANVAGLVVFATFGERRGSQTTQAGVLPSTLSTHSILFVSTNGRLSKNLGVAIANPNATAAHATLTLRDDKGAALATADVVIEGLHQAAEFVTQLFDHQPTVPQDLTGTLDVTSDFPVAVIGLRFRGENFSTLPATNLSVPNPVPAIGAGIGGPNAVVLAQFASGGGWATEIVLVNSGAAELTVRVDLFTKDGTPLVASLNGASNSSFVNIVIPAGGVVTLAPRDLDGDDGF
jgi:hypothetical protein